MLETPRQKLPQIHALQPTLLCIDDEENGLKMRKWLFETEGFQVFTALDGQTGIELFKTHSIDGVVLDYNMPGMNGIVVAEMLKKLQSSVPIIMLTGYPVPAEAINILIITKGGSPALLLAVTASLPHIRSHSHVELEGTYVAFVDGQRRYLDVTDGVCELLGYRRSELLQMRIDDVTGHTMGSNTLRLFQQYLADGLQRGSYVLRNRDGNEIPISYIARTFPTGAWWHAGSRMPGRAVPCRLKGHPQISAPDRFCLHAASFSWITLRSARRTRQA